MERGASAAMWAVRVDNLNSTAKKVGVGGAGNNKKGEKKKKQTQGQQLHRQQKKHEAAEAPKTARVTARERRARAAALRAQSSMKTRPSSASR